MLSPLPVVVVYLVYLAATTGGEGLLGFVAIDDWDGFLEEWEHLFFIVMVGNSCGRAAWLIAKFSGLMSAIVSWFIFVVGPTVCVALAAPRVLPWTWSHLCDLIKLLSLGESCSALPHEFPPVYSVFLHDPTRLLKTDELKELFGEDVPVRASALAVAIVLGLVIAVATLLSASVKSVGKKLTGVGGSAPSDEVEERVAKELRNAEKSAAPELITVETPAARFGTGGTGGHMARRSRPAEGAAALAAALDSSATAATMATAPSDNSNTKSSAAASSSRATSSSDRASASLEHRKPAPQSKAALAKERVRAEMAAGVEARLALAADAKGKKRKHTSQQQAGSDKRGRTS